MKLLLDTHILIWWLDPTLPITISHALAVGELPRHHNDPFDRILVAQAKVEGLTLVTRDENVKLYDMPFIVS